MVQGNFSRGFSGWLGGAINAGDGEIGLGRTGRDAEKALCLSKDQEAAALEGLGDALGRALFAAWTRISLVQTAEAQSPPLLWVGRRMLKDGRPFRFR